MTIFPKNAIVVADRWLAKVVDYDRQSKQYIMQGFVGVKLTYQMDDSYQLNGVITLAKVGDVCHVDDYDFQHEINLITAKTVTVKSHLGVIKTIKVPTIEEAGGSEVSQIKDSNPKDAVGFAKAPLSVLSGPVLYEDALGMVEGALKYGRHNYRVIGVRYSVYFDAMMRHAWAAWEGEDIDPESGLPHIIKIRTTLMVLRDAQIRGKCFDDRPRGTRGFIASANEMMKKLLEKHKDNIKDPYLGNGESDDYKGVTS